MDVQLLAPVIWEDEVVARVGSASHQTDIGGIDPGSLCVSAHEFFQEGFLTPGVKLVEGGVVRKDIEDTFRNMVRAPDLGVLDIRAKIASNNVMKERILRLVDRYGIDVIRVLFEQLIEHSDERARAKLRRIPDGTFTSTSYVEGIVDEYLQVQVTIEKHGDALRFSFEGSSPQTASSENLGVQGAMSASLNPLISMLYYDIPWNEGLFKSVEFDLPPGTIVNPAKPAAVSANTPTGANILVVTACQNAVAKMLLGSDEYRNDACGNSGAGHNTFVLTGVGPDGNFFATLILDGLAGGVGAFPDRDGTDTAQNHWSVRTMIANVETTERHYPVLYLWRRQVCDSGGPGRFRGGLGMMSALIPWRTAQLIDINVGSGALTRHCLGHAGGYPAANTPLGVVRGADVADSLFARGRLPRGLTDLDGAVERLPAKGTAVIGASDVVYGYLGSGGGGFGDPLERPAESVATDVGLGAVSRGLAEAVYGVLLKDGLEVDPAATEEKRDVLRRDRLVRARSSTLAVTGARWRPRRLAHLEAVDGEYRCLKCGQSHGSADRDFREFAASFDEPLEAGEPQELAPPEALFVLRHHCCPNCAVLFDTEMTPSSGGGAE